MKAGTVFRRIENFVAPKNPYLILAFFLAKAFLLVGDKKNLCAGQRF